MNRSLGAGVQITQSPPSPWDAGSLWRERSCAWWYGRRQLCLWQAGLCLFVPSVMCYNWSPWSPVLMACAGPAVTHDHTAEGSPKDASGTAPPGFAREVVNEAAVNGQTDITGNGQIRLLQPHAPGENRSARPWRVPVASQHCRWCMPVGSIALTQLGRELRLDRNFVSKPFRAAQRVTKDHACRR